MATAQLLPLSARERSFQDFLSLWTLVVDLAHGHLYKWQPSPGLQEKSFAEDVVYYSADVPALAAAIGAHLLLDKIEGWRCSGAGYLSNGI